MKRIRGLESEEAFAPEEEAREGGGAWTPHATPEVRCDVSRPGRHSLRVSLAFQAPLGQTTARERADAYLEAAGYRRVDDAHYRRGSLFGSLTGITPRSWQTVVTAEVKPDGDGSAVRAFFDANTLGQMVIPAEVEFWRAEASGLANAVLTGRPGADLSKAYAARARRAGFIAALLMIPAACLAALLRPAVDAVFDRWLPSADQPLFGLSSNNPSVVLAILGIIIAVVALSWWWRRRRR
jgi:hypothetical protein